MIFITDFSPLQIGYQTIMKEAYKADLITNHGVLLNKLITELKPLFHIDNSIIITNGTFPMQLSIKAFRRSRVVFYQIIELRNNKIFYCLGLSHCLLRYKPTY